MSKIKIGLFGFGVVGEGLHEVLKKAYTADAEIVKICVKHHNKKKDAARFLFHIQSGRYPQRSANQPYRRTDRRCGRILPYRKKSIGKEDSRSDRQ